MTNTSHRLSNWSGSILFDPAEHTIVNSESELVELVRATAESGRKLRAIGSLHSSSEILPVSGPFVSLSPFKFVKNIDPQRRLATIGAGTSIREAAHELSKHGLSFHNLGDVDAQTLVGATATGTHGSGRHMSNLSSIVAAVRLVDGTGRIREFSEERHGQEMRALRLSLGTLGIFTEIIVRLVPALRLRRQEWCLSTDLCLEIVDGLVERYRHVDFYWYPRRDDVKIRIAEESIRAIAPEPRAECVDDVEGFLHEVIPKPGHLDRRFEEMEYDIPLHSWKQCFQEVRERIISRHRKFVAWRVLVRWIARDDAFLSTTSGHDVVSISLHQNSSLPYREYFDDLEGIFRKYNGRPHWAKKFALSAGELRTLYPSWSEFNQIRRELDPGGVLLNQFLESLFTE